MPYSKKSELPESVKDVLPAHAQEIFMSAFNSAEKDNDEESAFKIAWAAVKKSYKKVDGKWVKEADVEKKQNLEEIYYGVTSFEQLDAQQEASERYFKMQDLSTAYKQMLDNIMDISDNDKIAEINRLTAEFTSRLGQLMEAEQREAIREIEGDKVELEEVELSPIEELQESDSGPLHAVVRIIKPGWGNKKHNHYYPKDVLQRDSYQFVGAKMYETDHKPQEKSTRTWVSTIEDIVGFEDGAPLAKVAIHDSNFAERLKNLDKLGILEKMECSIYANGLAKGGFKLGGREGKQVESITNVSSVDWVTRAGAGGAAVGLMEDESQEKTAEGQFTEILQEENNMPEEIIETQPEEVEEEQVEEVEIHEQEEEQEPGFLEVKEIKEILSETELPSYAQVRLSYSGRFVSAEEVKEAAQAELEYIKAVTRSGKPFGMNKGEPSKHVEKSDKFEELEEAKNELTRNFMGINK
jgi:cation transport regulator